MSNNSFLKEKERTGKGKKKREGKPQTHVASRAERLTVMPAFACAAASRDSRSAITCAVSAEASAHTAASANTVSKRDTIFSVTVQIVRIF